MDGSADSFVIDISQAAIGADVNITGYVSSRRDFTDYLAIRVRDITGSVLVLVTKTAHGAVADADASALKRGARVQIVGRVGDNAKGGRLINAVKPVRVLGNVNAQLSELDAEMREQASRMLLSRVCGLAAQFLRNEHFTEFESRMISSRWIEEGLEPIRVVYPGFGGPAVLATSPAPQVVDFLTTTGARRAFTLSTSFSTTYRFPNGAAELRVVVGMAVGIALDDLHRLMWNMSMRILERLGVAVAAEVQASEVPTVITATWPPPPFTATGSRSLLTLTQYHVDMPVDHGRLKASVDNIAQVRDGCGSVLVDGAREVLGKDIVIGRIVVYPSQFLELLQATPARQLKNLGKFNVWS